MAKHPDSVRPWAITDAPDGHWYKDCQAPFVPLLPHAIFFSTSNNYGYKYDELLGSTDSAPTSVDSLAVKALVTTAILILILIIYYAITAIPRLRHYNYENI
ncbi:unnamed protein product [Rotaria sp. Silwood1]|nr:unnamed protein product [Rotaria sp. Silwood1]